MVSMRRITILAIAMVLTCGAGWALASATHGTDPDLAGCAEPVGNVRASFDLAHARDLWSHIPKFKGAPELEIDAPAHVVVYAGPVRIQIAGKPGSVDTTNGVPAFNHVVCVSIGGEPTYYANVDVSVVNP